MKKYTLNSDEYNELLKAHAAFDKTIYGKKVKMCMTVLAIFVIMSLCICFMCFIINDFMNNDLDIYAAICGGLFFVNVSLMFVSQIIYENMVMNYLKFKK